MDKAQQLEHPRWLPPKPPGDEARIEDVHRLEPESLIGRPVFRQIATFVSETFGIENGGISVVDRDREYFIANTVDPDDGGSRDEAFCAHTVASKEPFVIEDAHLDAVFREHPHVLGKGIRFYAGAPITGLEGLPVGALCIRDTEPHAFSDEQRQLLTALAEIASNAMRTELDNRRLEERTLELEAALSHVQELQNDTIEARKLESLGSLAAGIAHEINTPIQFVGDNLQFVEEQLLPVFEALDSFVTAIDAIADTSVDSAALELAERLADSDFGFVRNEAPLALAQSSDGIRRISRIVRSLRDFSHPGTSSWETANLNKAIKTTLVICESRWKYAATVQMELDEALPPVACRVGEISQVIMNLVVNAADSVRAAGTDQGTIVVKTYAEVDEVVVEVSDNGTGIAPEVADRIFDPFFTTKEVGRGTGQGLAISQKVARDHRGSLTAQNQPNGGALFTLRVPIKTE